MHRYYEYYVGKRIMMIAIEGPSWIGLTVHVDRVKQYLTRRHNSIHLFDVRTRSHYLFGFWYQWILFWTLVWYRPHVIFLYAVYAAQNIEEFIPIVFYKRLFARSILVVVEHNQPPLIANTISEQRFFERYHGLIDRWVYIGSCDRQSLPSHAIVPSDRIFYESEFITPDVRESRPILRKYPLDLHTFLKIHYPLLLISNTDFVPERSLDFYGLDHTIAVMNALKAYYPHVGLIWAVAQATDPIKYAAARDRLCRGTLEYAVYFFSNKQPIWSLFRVIDLLFCPAPINGTVFDEARLFNVPIVGVETTQRPADVIMYRAKAVDDCVQKLLAVLPCKGRSKKPRILYEQTIIQT